jgi:citrate lyase synthetase
VAGSDRLDFFKKRFIYSGWQKNSFQFKKISFVVNHRETSPLNEFLISSSNLRKLASENNFEKFNQLLPNHVSKDLAKEIFNDVRNTMLLH